MIELSKSISQTQNSVLDPKESSKSLLKHHVLPKLPPLHSDGEDSSSLKKSDKSSDKPSPFEIPPEKLDVKLHIQRRTNPISLAQSTSVSPERMVRKHFQKPSLGSSLSANLKK
mmetsp:Transcript_29206/g.28828  ORF Transcript_29206/g.28828 Transcript_29206/m.28828 type:complete len:114 (+) Transcript_29206:410-751(+)